MGKERQTRKGLGRLLAMKLILWKKYYVILRTLEGESPVESLLPIPYFLTTDNIVVRSINCTKIKGEPSSRLSMAYSAIVNSTVKEKMKSK